MKKTLCALLALLCLTAGSGATALAEATETPKTEEIEIVPVQLTTEAPAAESSVLLGFEEGFALELPEGWKCYAPDAEMRENDVSYCLSDADGARWLYIQRWTSDRADIEALNRQIEQEAQPRTSGVYNYNGVDFVVYDLAEGDVSCCATLLNGDVLNFAFTPQSDREYMLIAIKIMGSFAIISDAEAE